jgi:hypothetical protein
LTSDVEEMTIAVDGLEPSGGCGYSTESTCKRRNRQFTAWSNDDGGLSRSVPLASEESTAMPTNVPVPVTGTLQPTLPPSDTASRIVNAVVVVVVLAIAAFVFVTVFDNAHEKVLPTASTLYGAFTTLIGTAIAAYFGISATRDVSNRATDSIAAAGQLAGDNRERLGALSGKLDALRSALPVAGADTHPALEQVRRVLDS